MVLLLYRWQFHQNQGSKRGFLATAAFASGFALAASAMTCGEWWTHGEETNVETNWEDAGFFTWLNHGEQFFLKPCEVRHGKNGEVQFFVQSMVVSHAIKTRFGQVNFFGFPSGNPQISQRKSPTSTPSAEKKTCKKKLFLCIWRYLE